VTDVYKICCRDLCGHTVAVSHMRTVVKYQDFSCCFKGKTVTLVHRISENVFKSAEHYRASFDVNSFESENWSKEEKM